MNTLRTAAQQALEALAVVINDDYNSPYLKIVAAMAALRAALEEPEGGGNLPPPLPGDFDHAIGADRFKVVRGAFWWHVLIGDSPTKHGKFHSRASAEKMAADLLREFRNGAFVQHEAALAEPEEDPELSAALGWAAGISEPVLDRKALLRRVAEIATDMQAKTKRAWDTGYDCGLKAASEFAAERRLNDAEIGEIWFNAKLPGVTETQARLLIRAAEAKIKDNHE